MAARYDALSSKFKRAAIILRLQVLQARTNPDRKILKALVVRFWTSLDRAHKAFKVLDDELTGVG